MDVPDVYRAPMRSGDDAVPDYGGVGRAIELGVCGTGGVLPRRPDDLPDALVQTADVYGERAAARLRRWASVPIGATVWTRDAAGAFHVGIVTGQWRYDHSPAARELDLVHVRSCRWKRSAPDLVPALVQDTFRRGGRNFQRITGL